MVRGTVSADQPSAVETEDNLKSLYCHIMHHLVIGPLHERSNRYCRREAARWLPVLQRMSQHAVPHMPTSKALSGISFIMMFSEHPVGMAGVIPTIFSFMRASSTIVFPNTSWYRGCFEHSAGLSARRCIYQIFREHGRRSGALQPSGNPFPFTVTQWRSLGPGIVFMSSQHLYQVQHIMPVDRPEIPEFHDFKQIALFKHGTLYASLNLRGQ